ncbi:Post-transcriptional regulator [Alicyclobacillus vulcanalis]|uniref:Post-transcriptional regulator n=1 Tax=Alicyclobacillus vulcanalis TaxID=252246 RepID=A0A1N7P925_9BACL|nr:Post-transcriptional regulator [Alicyclobacillus vulcanalis]
MDDPLMQPEIRPYADQVRFLCEAKVEEFRLMGYDSIDADAFWAYICSTLPKPLALYRLVDAILSAKPNDYMTYVTLGALRGDIERSEDV